MSGPTLAATSGIFASLASVFSKLAFESAETSLESFLLGKTCQDDWSTNCLAVRIEQACQDL